MATMAVVLAREVFFWRGVDVEVYNQGIWPGLNVTELMILKKIYKLYPNFCCF